MKPVAWMFALCTGLLAQASGALADQPTPWQMWHQPAASDMAARISWFDQYTFWFITPITIFVMLLLLYVMVRFNARSNPEPSKTSHNTLIEVIWTVGPIIVLIMIALPSFDLLNRQLAPEEEPTMTIKATGVQWYWDYEYQDDVELSFSSVMLKEEDREAAGKTDKATYPRLLAVDNELVVPVNTMVRVLVTASDVLHAFTVPALGFKLDGVPGRLNETWFKADKEGLYYGQCSELCGKDHAFMPIAIRVVSDDLYREWLNTAEYDLEGANQELLAAVYGDKNLKLAGNQQTSAERR